ncbi:transposase [Hymenobacter psoromatis]|uniref:transposase n=1 Tax=Hymenobacter psoromatis TaxID=1484116 RepID=UPI001CBB37B9|nr:transposase [Hymenobacter psoromatis]
MATEIKAIQCPKCGSIQKTEIRPGVFRCDSCGTEYFLDNDDININVRQVPATPVPAPAAPAGKASVGVLLILGAVLLVIIVGIYLTNAFFDNQVTSSATSSATAARHPWHWHTTQTALVSGSGQQPLLLVAGDRENDDLDGNPSSRDSVGFYNAATGAKLKLVGLPGSPTGGITLRQFSNGTVFLLFGTTTVYRVNAQSLTVEDVSKTLFQDQPALASGVASIGTGNNEDDSFYLFTNDGHHYNYYPLIHQLYTNDEQSEAKFGIKSLRPGSTLQTGFAFSRASDTYPDDPIQLITYQYHDNGSGPKAGPNFEWDDDYGGSGVFTDADPHVKRLITPYWVQLDRLTGYHDFTPGRLYFSPSLLYYDADYVLITLRPTAAGDSPLNLQALDAHTGAIRFTTPLPGELSRDADVLRYPAGLIIANGLTTYTLSPSGKLGSPVSIP